MQQTRPASNRRPLPRPSDLTTPFWEACKRNELLVQQCHDCGHKFFPPLAACSKCFSTNVDWVRSSGKGVVYSFSVLHREPTPGFPVPTVLAIVDLDDGYAMLTNIVGCPSNKVKIDMPVEVTFETCSPEISLPMFQPVA